MALKSPLEQFTNSIGLHDFIYSPGLFVFEDKSIMRAAYVADILDQHRLF